MSRSAFLSETRLQTVGQRIEKISTHEFLPLYRSKSVKPLGIFVGVSEQTIFTRGFNTKILRRFGTETLTRLLHNTFSL